MLFFINKFVHTASAKSDNFVCEILCRMIYLCVEKQLIFVCYFQINSSSTDTEVHNIPQKAHKEGNISTTSQPVYIIAEMIILWIWAISDEH